MRLIELLDLLLKDGTNGTRGIAELEPGGERMYKEVVLRALLIFVQGIIDDQLKVGGRRRDSGMSVRHGGESQQFVCASEDNE